MTMGSFEESAIQHPRFLYLFAIYTHLFPRASPSRTQVAAHPRGESFALSMTEAGSFRRRTSPSAGRTISLLSLCWGQHRWDVAGKDGVLSTSSVRVPTYGV